MIHPVALTRVRWRPSSQGGRGAPPSGPTYASVAHFTDDSEVFSVRLRLLQTVTIEGQEGHEAEVTLLAPDLLPECARKLVPGARLVIQEGRREVADGEVISVRLETLDHVQDRLGAIS